MIRCLTVDRHLSEALERFVRILVVGTEDGFKELDIILVHDEYPLSEADIREMCSLADPRVVVMSEARPNPDGIIAIWAAEEFEANVRYALNIIGRNPRALLCIRALNNQIRFFFKEHGHRSGMESLIMAMQGIANYLKSLDRNIASERDMREAFLKPGLTAWHEFRKKYERFSLYLRLLGLAQLSEECSEPMRAIGVIVGEIETIETLGRERAMAIEEAFAENMGHLERELMSAHSTLFGS